mgnify:CR=1 FL=1
MSVTFVFLVAGLIILIGFLGSISFERTKVPDVLLLLGIGILLGPVMKLIDPGQLTHFTEYFGAFALMIILFDGGMDTGIERLIKEFSYAVLLVVLSFGLTVCTIYAVLYFLMGWNVLNSLLLATILGCTSAAIIIPVTSGMSLKPGVKTLLAVESTLSDVFAVVLAISLLQFISLEHIGIEQPLRHIASSFSIAIVLGVTVGFVWLKVLDWFKGGKYSYMTTLSAILLLYSVVEFLGGGGPIAVLIFGIILGNGHAIVKFLKLNSKNTLDETLKFFHGEVTFIIRTFFFVYLGMILSPDFIKPEMLYVSGVITLIIFVVRYISVEVMGMIDGKKKDDKHILVFMIPRGLATAVLATIPSASKIPGCEYFTEYAFGVIVMTNILMTVGVYYTEKRKVPTTEK